VILISYQSLHSKSSCTIGCTKR